MTDRNIPSNQYVAEKPCCSVCDRQKVCHVCKEQTLFACADCRMNFGAVVYVCAKTACRDEHERKCFGTGEPDDRRTRPVVETSHDAEDAARYRWIKDHIHIANNNPRNWAFVVADRTADLDAAIDAERLAVKTSLPRASGGRCSHTNSDIPDHVRQCLKLEGHSGWHEFG